MKKFSTGLITGLLLGFLLATTTFAFAAPQIIKLVINGEEIHPDVPPQMMNGRVLVPARFVAEPLGAKVEWDNENKMVRVTSKTVTPKEVQKGEIIMAQPIMSVPINFGPVMVDGNSFEIVSVDVWDNVAGLGFDFKYPDGVIPEGYRAVTVKTRNSPKVNAYAILKPLDGLVVFKYESGFKDEDTIIKYFLGVYPIEAEITHINWAQIGSGKEETIPFNLIVP